MITDQKKLAEKYDWWWRDRYSIKWNPQDWNDWKTEIIYGMEQKNKRSFAAHAFEVFRRFSTRELPSWRKLSEPMRTQIISVFPDNPYCHTLLSMVAGENLNTDKLAKQKPTWSPLYSFNLEAYNEDIFSQLEQWLNDDRKRRNIAPKRTAKNIASWAWIEAIDMESEGHTLNNSERGKKSKAKERFGEFGPLIEKALTDLENYQKELGS